MPRGSLLRLSVGGASDIYYIDATGGNDNNNGRSASAAWQTIAKVNTSSFNPGDHILFKRGETFRGQLDPSNGGSSGLPIVFGAYSDGGNPTISTAALVTGWSATVGQEYKASFAHTPSHVYANDVQLTLGAAAGALNEDEYFHDGGADETHVRLAGGANPNNATMEITAATLDTRCLQLDVSYLTFENLILDKAEYINVDIRQAVASLTDIILSRCTLTRAGQNAIAIGDNATNNPNNVTIQDCTIQLWDRDFSDLSAILAYAGATGGDDLLIQRNLIEGWIPFGADTNRTRDGITLLGGDNPQILHNEITAVDHAIELRNNGTTSWVVAYNFIHDTGDDAIYLKDLDDATGKVYNNILINISDNFFDLSTGAGNFGLIAFNTCYNCLTRTIRAIGSNGMQATFKCNIFGITKDPTQRFIVSYDLSGTQNFSDFTFDRNVYYDYVNTPGSAIFMLAESGWGNRKSFAEWQTDFGLDANSFVQDPLFDNIGGSDPEDYKVGTLSPAVGNGEVIAGITNDYDSVTRGSPPDIGAYEYVE